MSEQFSDRDFSQSFRSSQEHSGGKILCSASTLVESSLITSTYWQISIMFCYNYLFTIFWLKTTGILKIELFGLFYMLKYIIWVGNCMCMQSDNMDIQSISQKVLKLYKLVQLLGLMHCFVHAGILRFLSEQLDSWVNRNWTHGNGLQSGGECLSSSLGRHCKSWRRLHLQREMQESC